MLIRHQKRSQSLLARILSVYLITMIPIIVLQYYNYTWSAKMVSDELSTSARSNISYLRDSLRSTVDAIVSSEEYLISSAIIPRYMTYYDTMTPSQEYTYIIEIVDRVSNVRYSHPVMERLTLYYPMQNRLFWVDSVRASTNLPLKFEGNLSAEEKNDILLLYKNRNSVLVHDGKSFCILYAKQVNDNEPHLLLKADLKQDALQNMISAFDIYSEQKAFMIHWESGKVVASTDALQSMGDALADSASYHGSEELYQFDFTFEGNSYVAFCADITSLGVTIVQMVNHDLLNAIPNRLQMLLYVMAGLAVLLSVIYFFSMHHMVNRPVRELVNGFGSAGQGKLDVRMNHYGTSEFASLSNGFNAMMGKLNDLISQNYEQKILLQQAQLRQLHSQIEPHFLYNSFFMLRHTIDADEIEKAERICDYLGEYFRFITRQGNEPLPLEDEFAHTMNYISIQEMRFAPHLTMDIQPPPEHLARMRVPPLILQPLIENAIQHGIPKRSACICLHFADEGETLRVHVEDNGQNATDECIAALNRLSAGDGVNGSHALQNIHNRLQLYYGPEYGLRFYRSTLGGLGVEMRLGKRKLMAQKGEEDEDVSQHSDCG